MENKMTEPPSTPPQRVPNNLLRYLSLRVKEYGRRCTSEYLRQITKGTKRPHAQLAITLQDITGVAKEDWMFAPQSQVNAELVTNYPPTGRWTEVLLEYRGVRV